MDSQDVIHKFSLSYLFSLLLLFLLIVSLCWRLLCHSAALFLSLFQTCSARARKYLQMKLRPLQHNEWLRLHYVSERDERRNRKTCSLSHMHSSSYLTRVTLQLPWDASRNTSLKIKTSFIHTHVVPDPHDCLSSMKNKIRNDEESWCNSFKVISFFVSHGNVTLTELN